MKKITFIMDYLGSGGAERVTSILVDYFSNENYEVNIIVANKDRNDYVLDKRANIIFLPQDKNNSKLHRFKSRYIALKGILISISSDVIISLANAWFDFRLISTFQTKNCKLIMSERNDPARHPQSRIMRIIRNFNYRFADIVVFQTPGAKEYFSKKIQSKGVIIPNPLKQNLPKPYVGKRRKVIVTYCRLHEQKNLKMLIDAFNILQHQYDDYKLEIYGRGELKDELNRYIDILGIKHKVSIKDFEKNIHNKINDCSMYVSSSNYEGISNSMLEALAIGLPTICTDSPPGGARMFINSYENGILVPVGDTNGLYEAMKYMIDNPKKSEEMSINSIKIRNELAVDLICKKWIDLL